ncbi:hypothetical protein ACU8KH_01532 [Lachancea thermotolerans]
MSIKRKHPQGRGAFSRAVTKKSCKNGKAWLRGNQALEPVIARSQEELMSSLAVNYCDEKVLTTAMIELVYTRVSTLSGAYEDPQVVLADWEQSMRAILRSIDELHLNRKVWPEASTRYDEHVNSW